MSERTSSGEFCRICCNEIMAPASVLWSNLGFAHRKCVDAQSVPGLQDELTTLRAENEALRKTIELLHGPLSVAALTARADAAEAELASLRTRAETAEAKAAEQQTIKEDWRRLCQQHEQTIVDERFWRAALRREISDALVILNAGSRSLTDAATDRMNELSLANVKVGVAIEALKPFAEFGGATFDRLPASMPMTKGSPIACRQVTVADFLRARSILQEAGE